MKLPAKFVVVASSNVIVTVPSTATLFVTVVLARSRPPKLKVKPPPPTGKPEITIVVRCEPGVVVATTGIATPVESSGTQIASVLPSAPIRMSVVGALAIVTSSVAEAELALFLKSHSASVGSSSSQPSP